jgi:enoyl-CoA hydratase / 3-hydroxyacyl-CoA dehydrogenase
MAFTLKGRPFDKVGVIGSGQIGPDIALFFAKALSPFGVSVKVIDISEVALASGRQRVEKKIAKGVEGGAFTPEEQAAMLGSLEFTSNYENLAGAGLVVEAATENAAIKRSIVAKLEALCGDGAILASNSSHMEPETIFSEAKHPERGLVIHYFFPAERNLIVEVVPGKATSPAVAEWAMDFYEALGKVPIRVKSRYGYALDPIFEGLFQAAALGVEAGWGTVMEVDVMAQRALGVGVGPFTAMNLTGGNPITAHGLDEMHTKVNPWFRTPKLMADQLAKNTPWDTAGRGMKVEVSDDRYRPVADFMMGAYFGLVGQIIDSSISNVSDLELAIETALVMRPPFAWMNELGPAKVLALVEGYARANPTFPVPACLKNKASTGKPWLVALVLRRDVEGVAILTIRRPKVLNALNLEVFRQLQKHCEDVEKDAKIRGAVITGHGTKAFVSGADIDMLAQLKTATEGSANAQQFHKTLDFIDGMKKPVVCAMNGLAFGGGNELAMACHVRIARKGLKVLAGQPEVNLGIIPGAGGTQRLPRLIGIEPAARIMRTAKPLSGAEALSLGLVEEEVEGDLVGRAVKLVSEIADGRKKLRPIPRDPLAQVPDRLSDVDLGHRSKVIDSILCGAIIDGARKSLRDGLALEIKAFGACVETKDMHIGMDNFVKNGPRAKAAFVHG